jgi:hypothetical protein
MASKPQRVGDDVLLGVEAGFLPGYLAPLHHFLHQRLIAGHLYDFFL